jgi:hypothetical protein
MHEIAMVSPMKDSFSLSEAENSNVKMCTQTVRTEADMEMITEEGSAVIAWWHYSEITSG